MSSDTAKENASVVESSVTEWKHDMENLNDSESPSYKPDEGTRQSGAEERVHRCDQVGISTANKKDKLYGTRYFIIKSLNHENIQLSIERGIWATQDMNEPILEEAFRNSGKVILIFSVNMSGSFQGYAQMMSSIGWRRDNVWSQGIGGRSQWGCSFKVKWLQLCDLPFQKTLHLKNPLNNYKPVKISRDCQELPQDIGEALCELIDGNIDVDVKLKRDDHPLERPFIGNPLALRDEEYTLPPVHMTWAQTPMLYPALLYQHQVGPSKFHLEHQRSSEVLLLPGISPVTSGASILSQEKHSHINGSLISVQVDQDNFSRLSVERSPLASTLTEDDILEMSYEEYLEVHCRSNKQLYHDAAGPSWRTQKSTGKEHGDDLYPYCNSQKRSRHTYHK